MVNSKNYNFSQGFLSLISLLITLLIIIILIFGIYFGFNKVRFNKNDQSGQPEQFSPQDEIEKAKETKDLLESQQKSLEKSIEE